MPYCHAVSAIFHIADIPKVMGEKFKEATMPWCVCMEKYTCIVWCALKMKMSSQKLLTCKLNLGKGSQLCSFILNCFHFEAQAGLTKGPAPENCIYCY